MTVTIRPAVPADTPACGRILYTAFKEIAERHNFPADFSSLSQATQVAGYLIQHAEFYGVVAESSGRILGSNFLAEADAIRAVGPISVEPGAQQRGIGRQLMEAVLARAASAIGVRLVQDAFNAVSMALYASLGFDVREPLVLLAGKPAGMRRHEVEVRPLLATDIEACAALCKRVHGTERTHELRNAISGFAPFVAVRAGRVTAYATTLSLWQVAHGVAESEEDMQQLILGGSAARPEPLSFLLPLRQGTLFRWCLAAGLRVVKPLTLMTLRTYQEPRGCYFPSVAY
jgi:GNAT superfamily N-acetyltransferase